MKGLCNSVWKRFWIEDELKMDVGTAIIECGLVEVFLWIVTDVFMIMIIGLNAFVTSFLVH